MQDSIVITIRKGVAALPGENNCDVIIFSLRLSTRYRFTSMKTWSEAVARQTRGRDYKPKSTPKAVDSLTKESRTINRVSIYRYLHTSNLVCVQDARTPCSEMLFKLCISFFLVQSKTKSFN